MGKLIKGVPYDFCLEINCKYLQGNKCTLEGEYCNEGKEKCEDCIVGYWSSHCQFEGDLVFRESDEEDCNNKFNYCPICGFKIDWSE